MLEQSNTASPNLRFGRCAVQGVVQLQVGMSTSRCTWKKLSYCGNCVSHKLGIHIQNLLSLDPCGVLGLLDDILG